jgi:hypothetical protein
MSFDPSSISRALAGYWAGQGFKYFSIWQGPLLFLRCSPLGNSGGRRKSEHHMAVVERAPLNSKLVVLIWICAPFRGRLLDDYAQFTRH